LPSQTTAVIIKVGWFCKPQSKKNNRNNKGSKYNPNNRYQSVIKSYLFISSPHSVKLVKSKGDHIIDIWKKSDLIYRTSFSVFWIKRSDIKILFISQVL
jgi:hypothetical protein